MSTSGRLGAQAQEVSKDLKEMGDIVKDAAQEKLKHMRENADECYQHGRDKVHSVVSTFEQYIRERPVKSVLIAAGVGLLYGRFWMRR